jgi:hypothetical protein
MKVYILIRACKHTGRMIILAHNASEAIKIAQDRTNEDWVILQDSNNFSIPTVLYSNLSHLN